jgi:serine/threonine protein kinase
VAEASGDELIDHVVDQVMRGRDPDVEALIARSPGVEEATREKLRKVAVAFASGSRAVPVEAAKEDALPFAELGPYTLVSRMGEGGMGMVYLAEHRFLRRQVAIKVIRPELAVSTATRLRFQREAMSIAKLRHENIVSVYDAGELDGVAFLAMELVEGQGLDDILRAKRRAGERMPVDEAVRHARGIARALQCAHDAGIIHRDVKPANVRITPDGRELLLDFGLSLTEELGSISSFQGLRGTPMYASPEQLEMDSSKIDARTDVYSLGVMLYECLAGEPPFSGANMNQLFHQILSRDPIEPRKLNEAVDEELDSIVMRAIARRREDRYASAGEMAQALDAWLKSPERNASVPRGRSSRLKALAAAVVMLALGIATWLVLAHRDGAATSAPITRTQLFGTAAETQFGNRLIGWGELIGGGTFGDDPEGPGVIGNSKSGISAKPRALHGGKGSVRGTVAPIAPGPNARTLASGAGIEYADGRILALVFDVDRDGYEPHLCELLREGQSTLVRGMLFDSSRQPQANDGPWSLELSWTDTETKFEWRGAGVSASSSSNATPLLLPNTARPRRCVLIVQDGSARFEDWVLEES